MTIGAHLWIEHGDGAATAHEVVQFGQPHMATIDGRRRRTQDVRLVGSGAQRSVPINELADAAPLNPAEEREYERLDRMLAGTFGDSEVLRKFNALRLRSLHFSEGVPA